MLNVLAIEFGKLLRLSSIRFTAVILILFPLLWGYAPGIFKQYELYLISAYQVPALSLSSGITYLLPLLVAIASAELLGLEMNYNTLPTILLRPVTRSQWLTAKIIVAVIYPFILLALLLLISLLAGLPLGYGSFVGGTGLGPDGLLGSGTLSPSTAMGELLRAYILAGCTLVPIGLLSILLTIIFMNTAAGTLGAVSALILMYLMAFLPKGIYDYFLSNLIANAYKSTDISYLVFIALGLYCAAFAAAAVILFERKDF
ncbi:MAG: ABC transporter permease [Trueperaceae bacterium]